MTRAIGRTLAKVWDADLSLQDLKDRGSRLSDLALIEDRVRATLPPGALTPRDLRDAGLERVGFASAVLGSVELDRLSTIPFVWRPLLQSLGNETDLCWRNPGASELEWFTGKVLREPSPPPAPATIISCANPSAEVVESLRWARELLVAGKARPEEIAITATSPEEWDDQFLVFAADADLPVHFSHGIPALSTREGQTCAALADALINGLSQDRLRRLVGHTAGQGRPLRELPDDWAIGLKPGAGLFDADQWRRALDNAAPVDTSRSDPRPMLLPLIDLLAGGPANAEPAGELLLGSAARDLWTEALRRAPAEGLEFSLQGLRVPDGLDPGVSIAWCPASDLVAAPRPWVRLLGLTSRSWPRRGSEDPLLPDHILPSVRLDPDPVTSRDRTAFRLITAAASGACVLSRSRRNAHGGLLTSSPLMPQGIQPVILKRGRLPQHAFSENDRLLARPVEATTNPVIAAATACWTDWRSSALTSHDGLTRAGHPVVKRAILETQSATSLRLMLRDPLGFVWRYGLGWRPSFEEERPLSIEPRVFGELVHELLQRTVDTLEPRPGFLRATKHEVEAALESAVEKTGTQWPLERAIPPLLLWQHTLSVAAALAFRALTLDESFQPGTRSWTELAFGDELAAERPDLPWNPRTPVSISNTGVRVRGRIDRLDLNATGDVRVSDYKTGTEPKQAERIILGGGGELQRVIYGLACRQLLPGPPRVIARLLFLGESKPRSFPLPPIEAVVDELASYLKAACALLDAGTLLPGPDSRERWNEFRLALPAATAPYFRVKQPGLARAFADFSHVWASQ